jgi:hypothetical protein
MSKTTDKALVLRKNPEAISHQWADGWQIYTKPAEGYALGEGGWKRAHRAWNAALNAIVESTPPKGLDSIPNSGGTVE